MSFHLGICSLAELNRRAFFLQRNERELDCRSPTKERHPCITHFFTSPSSNRRTSSTALPFHAKSIWWCCERKEPTARFSNHEKEKHVSKKYRLAKSVNYASSAITVPRYLLSEKNKMKPPQAKKSIAGCIRQGNATVLFDLIPMGKCSRHLNERGSSRIFLKSKKLTEPCNQNLIFCFNSVWRDCWYRSFQNR